jgi:hypothetical protein
MPEFVSVDEDREVRGVKEAIGFTLHDSVVCAGIRMSDLDRFGV